MSQSPDREIAARPAHPRHDDPPGNGRATHGGGEPEEIHLPPNSWVPLSVSLSLTVLFVGFLLARPLNFVVCMVGGLWFVGSLVGWYTSARTEYGELH